MVPATIVKSWGQTLTIWTCTCRCTYCTLHTPVTYTCSRQFPLQKNNQVFISPTTIYTTGNKKPMIKPSVFDNSAFFVWVVRMRHLCYSACDRTEVRRSSHVGENWNNSLVFLRASIYFSFWQRFFANWWGGGGGARAPLWWLVCFYFQ